MTSCLIGTSGYSYKHWAEGVFYPPGVPQSRWLEFYCENFNAVELNVTFYRLPKEATFEGWYKRTPKDFSFVVKGSRFITHIKRLKDVQESLNILSGSSAALKSKLRCFLWQFPSSFQKNTERLEAFCEQLKTHKFFKGLHHVFEFRNQTWFSPDVYSILKNFGFCLCFADGPERIGEEVKTCDYIYLRFHGVTSFCNYDYSDEELKAWAAKAKALNPGACVYAFFNNDVKGYAVYNAKRFRELLK